jgi:hypothetical protein
MFIRVKFVKENKDGSADVEIKVDQEGHVFLMQRGLTEVLWDAIEMEKKNVSKSASGRRKSLRPKSDTAVGLHSDEQPRVSRRKRS